MDWLDPGEDERAVLAISRIPATDRGDYRGPVFFNPGVSLFEPPLECLWNAAHRR